jgi:hypothetical protein
MALRRVISSDSRSKRSIWGLSRPAPGNRCRNSVAELRSRRWYSSLVISSIRRLSWAPPRRSKSAFRSRPYFMVTQCQPAASNIALKRLAAMSGTTRSRDCRFRSTIQRTSPNRATIGSAMASQHAPSSSSASPTNATCRPPAGASNFPETYRWTSAPQIGAVTPNPSDPVE